MSNYSFRKKRSTFPYIFILLLMLGIGFYVYFSNNFERIPPTIKIKDHIFWNLKEPIKLSMSDNLAIGSYKISLFQDDKEILLESKNHLKHTKHLDITLKSPKSKLLSLKKKTFLKIEAYDKSFWNFAKGNKSVKVVEIIIDKRKPIVNIISKSYALRKGGSALVVFEARDKNLDSLYIQSSSGKRFQVVKFLKKGFYISLIGNSLKDKNFKMYIIAKDKAGNITKNYIPFYYKDKRYRISKIKLKDRFLEGKIEQLFFENYDKSDGDSFTKIQKFKFVNETMRKNNGKLIAKNTNKILESKFISFNIKPFIPLKNSKKVGSFGDHRYFHYKGEFVSESYHLGIDLASIKNDKILLSNNGKVVFAGHNGIYGNMPIIYHGLGLYTLYGHCSTLFVNEGDIVRVGDVIAKTGATGLALGDHLHFGVLVQGVEVRPQEWLDKNWIKANITDIIQRARKIIEKI